MTKTPVLAWITTAMVALVLVVSLGLLVHQVQVQQREAERAQQRLEDSRELVQELTQTIDRQRRAALSDVRSLNEREHAEIIDLLEQVSEQLDELNEEIWASQTR